MMITNLKINILGLQYKNFNRTKIGCDPQSYFYKLYFDIMGYIMSRSRCICQKIGKYLGFY